MHSWTRFGAPVNFWALLRAPRPGRSRKLLEVPWREALLGAPVRSYTLLEAPGRSFERSRAPQYNPRIVDWDAPRHSWTRLGAPGSPLGAPGRSWTLLGADGRSRTLLRAPGRPTALLVASWRMSAFLDAPRREVPFKRYLLKGTFSTIYIIVITVAIAKAIA